MCVQNLTKSKIKLPLSSTHHTINVLDLLARVTGQCADTSACYLPVQTSVLTWLLKSDLADSESSQTRQTEGRLVKLVGQAGKVIYIRS